MTQNSEPHTPKRSGESDLFLGRPIPRVEKYNGFRFKRLLRGRLSGEWKGGLKKRDLSEYQGKAHALYKTPEAFIRFCFDAILEFHKGFDLVGLVGFSLEHIGVLASIAEYANGDFPVYLFGETGTGKELVAECLHRNGRGRKQRPRGGGKAKQGPFVAFNCGALCPDLMASELFGHHEGAFTDARFEARGLLETAGGGTLFLDEISSLPPAGQALLLRAIETGEFKPVGAEPRGKSQSTAEKSKAVGAKPKGESQSTRGKFKARLVTASNLPLFCTDFQFLDPETIPKAAGRIRNAMPKSHEEPSEQEGYEVWESLRHDLIRDEILPGFRPDLFQRLSTCRINLAPLRVRPADVILLIPHLQAKILLERGIETPTLTPEICAFMIKRKLYGNVRELERWLLNIGLRAGENNLFPETPFGDDHQVIDFLLGGHISKRELKEPSCTLVRDVEILLREGTEFLRELRRVWWDRLGDSGRLKTEIERLRQEGIPRKRIADYFGVPANTISHALARSSPG